MDRSHADLLAVKLGFCTLLTCDAFFSLFQPTLPLSTIFQATVPKVLLSALALVALCCAHRIALSFSIFVQYGICEPKKENHILISNYDMR